MSQARSFDVTCYTRSRSAPEKEVRAVVREGALAIGVDGKSEYVIMRTPGNDRELALGFLFSEGMIHAASDVAMLMECPDAPGAITIRTTLAGGVVERNLVINSSCGLCGRADLEALLRSLPAAEGDFRVDVSVLYDVPKAVRKAQTLFTETGGTHAAALFDRSGRIVAVREDVGRHNALDKVIGHALLAGGRMNEMGAFLSGRASLEMIVKAARARIPLVAAVSAPTDAAVDAARRLGITLCGFVRGDEATVYSRGDRLCAD